MSLNQFLIILLSPSDEIIGIFNLIIAFGLAVLMFGLGMKITIYDIKKTFVAPKDLLTGLFLQIILIPLIGLVYILTTDFSPNVQLGIMVIACMPSAATSNYITSKINGDLPLSITFYLNMFTSVTNHETTIFEVYYTNLIIRIFIFITLPIIIGAILTHYFSRIKVIEKSLDKLSIVLFIVIMKLAIYLSILNIQNAGETFIAVFGFMAVILFSVFFVIKLSNISFKRTKTLFAEALLQNNALGFMIVFSISANTSGLLPVLAMYAVGQYIVLVLLFYALLKNKTFLTFDKI